MIKTPLPVRRQKDTDTDTDKFFAYLASHVTRFTTVQPIATISQDQSARLEPGPLHKLPFCVFSQA